MKKIFLFLLTILCMLNVLNAQLFQQQYNTAGTSITNTNSPTVATPYASATPANGQFDHITSNNASATVAFNGTNMSISRTSGTMLLTRATDMGLAANSAIVSFDLTFSATGTSTSNGLTLMLGSGFTATSTTTIPTTANIHSAATFIVSTSGAVGTAKFKINGGATQYAANSTKITWVTNNSGATMSYMAPDGTCETIADDTYDFWIGTVKEVNDALVTGTTTAGTATQTITDFAMRAANGSSTYLIDNLLIDPIPSSVTSTSATSVLSTSFNANWNAVTGATGYRLDVATDAAFTSLVSGYNNLYISGAATNTLAITGLSPTTTYYYRVRAVSQYTVAEYSSCNSSTQTLTTTSGTTPTILVSTTSLIGFSQIGIIPSASQSYTVSGTLLTSSTVDITAPANFEISDDNSIWGTSLSFPVSGGTITGQPKTVYARLNNSTTGSYTGNITNVSTGAATVNVSLSGTTLNTPTITVTPTTLLYGGVLVNTTSATQSYNLSAILLSPASDNITITPPSGYQVSLSAGSGFGTSLTVPYTGGILASTPIFVKFLPTAVAAYNGNITNGGGGASIVNVAVTGAGVLQQIGDFAPSTNGNWGSTLATSTCAWKQWDGTAFNTTATAIPTAADNVWIPVGIALNLENGTTKNCKNLVVDGTLTSATLVNTPTYLSINGSVFKVTGFVGNSITPTGDNGDGISLSVVSTNLTVSGTGTNNLYLSRIRMQTSGSTFIVDKDMTLTYHGGTNQGGHTTGFHPNAATVDNTVLTINTGKTLTLAPWTAIGTTSSGNALPASNMTINVNGTITLQKTPAPNTNPDPSYNSYIYGGTTAPAVFTLNVNNGGIVNTPELYPNGLATADAIPTGNDAVINVAAGGILNVDSAVDLRKATQIISGAGTFNLGTKGKIRIGSVDGITASGATGSVQTTTRTFPTDGFYEYGGATAQVTGNGLPSTVGTLNVKNIAGTTLTNAVTATDSLRLTTGNLILGANDITTNKITNASSASYVVTDGGGALKLNIPATTGTYALPVGTVANYRPATIAFTAAPIAGTLAARAVAGAPGNAGLPLVESGITTPNDNITTTAPDYWEVNSTATGGTYDITLTGNGQAGISSFALTTLLKRDNAGANWALPGTYVTTTGTNTAPVMSRTGLTSFSQFAVGGGANGVLPLQLINFNASVQNNNVQLLWSTAQEFNMLKYEIEKSSNGIAYNKIGEVAAHNSYINQYNFNDVLNNGTIFYRLKIISTDGSSKWSKVVVVNSKNTSALAAFPNPVVNEVYVTHKKATVNATMELFAITGALLLKSTIETNSTQSTLELSNLPKGIYQLVYTNGSEKETISLLKK